VLIDMFIDKGFVPKGFGASGEGESVDQL